jgi:LacI family transcriptional regulator
MKRITMQDIAQKAGVTKATVSMVINNDKRITETTRQKVLKIIQELKYYPNESARKLAMGKADTIAFMAPRFGPPFIASILEAFEDKAFENDKVIQGIQPYATRNQTALMEDILKKILYGRKADAVVILTQKPSEETVKEYIENKIPMVLIENEVKGVHSVRVDNFLGAERATEYLIKKGRKNIGLIAGAVDANPNWSANPSAMERFQGYQKALKSNGMKFDPDKAVFVVQYAYEEGAESLEQLLRKNKKLDAVFCAAGDIVAIGVMEQAKKRGLNIPGDLAVIGYDDLLASRMLNPPLTTVRQSFREIAAIAFGMAMDSIEGKLKEEKHIVIEPELILRDSA